MGIDIKGDFLFCQNHSEDIDHIFNEMLFVQKIWNTIAEYCPIPFNCNISFIDCIEYIWRYEKVCNKSYQRSMENIFVIAWSIWIYMNSVKLKIFFVQPAYVIKLAVNPFKGTMYCQDVSRTLGLDSSTGVQIYSRRIDDQSLGRDYHLKGG